MDTAVTNFEMLYLALLCLCVALFGNMQTNLLLESQGEKNKTEHQAGHDERACLGGSAGGS